MDQFLKKHQSQVVGVLSGWDRIRFRGTLRVLARVAGLFTWISEQGVLLKQFKDFSMSLTEQLQTAVTAVATAAGRKIEYLASSTLSKEALVQEILRRENCPNGIVCVFSCVESCQSFEIRRDREKQKIDLVPQLRKCLHWYVYLIHDVWGLCHVRIQSWLPFTVHICVNGRDWLCQDLTREGVGFMRRDNCLIDVADQSVAQRLLDQQSRIDWNSQLQALLERVCPVLGQLSMRDRPLRHYWSADETEWATDIMFRSPTALAALYPRLIHHAISTFSSADVMRFLGQKKFSKSGGVNPTFQGEVVSDLSQRPEGVRVKHRRNSNSIKMYDKQGSVLRVETTVNNPREFKVYRASESDPQGPKRLQLLRKGVADLPRRAEVSHAANSRYLTSLAAVDSPTPLGQVLDRFARPRVHNGHRSRGLHPLEGTDARLLERLLSGEFAVNGFRNRDLVAPMFGDAKTPIERRRDSAKIGRLLRLFRDHGLIYRVKGTHRYQLSAEGRRTLPPLLAARKSNTAKLVQTAT